MSARTLQVVDAAEDATWEWYCAHHGLLMSPRQIPLESLDGLLADLLASAAPGTTTAVRFGFAGPDPVTGDPFAVRPDGLVVDGPAFADEVFLYGPLRVLRLAARVIEPGHDYGDSYRELMIRLAEVAFTATVAAHLRASYDRAGSAAA